MIPQRDTVWAAVVETPAFYERCTAPWDRARFGLNMQPARDLVTNKFYKHHTTPNQLLVTPLRWKVIDYSAIENSNVRAELAWTVSREGTAHGVVVWFDATLAQDVHFSNAPGEPEHIYGNAFFPWLEPVRLAPGDTVTVVLRGDLIETEYTWRWTTCVTGGDDVARVKATFDQSTFFGVPLSPSTLRGGAGQLGVARAGGAILP
jgi:protein arginine N-methyltransferase 1